MLACLPARSRRTAWLPFPPNLPTLQNLTDWAGKLLRDLPGTKQRMREIVDLRVDASRRVEREVATARDAFNDGTHILARIYMGGVLSLSFNEQLAIEAMHREAVAHVRCCLDSLHKITRS